MKGLGEVRMKSLLRWELAELPALVFLLPRSQPLVSDLRDRALGNVLCSHARILK